MNFLGYFVHARACIRLSDWSAAAFAPFRFPPATIGRPMLQFGHHGQCQYSISMGLSLRDSPNESPVPGLPSTLPRLCTSTEYEVFVGSVWLSPPAIRSDQARLRQHIKSRRSPSCLGSLVQVNSSPPRGCQSLKSSGDRLTNRFRPDLLSFPPARAAATLVFISKVSACPPRNAVDSGRCFAWSQDR